MDFLKIRRLIVAGSFHGFSWWALGPASTEGPGIQMLTYACLLFSGLYVLGALLAPSEPAETVIAERDPAQPFD